jgi:hypothetical protein
VAFALVNAGAALRLAGWSPSWRTPAPTAVTANVVLGSGVQTVTMTQGSRGYTPADSVVYAGIPIRWVITSDSGFSCAAYLRDGSGWRADLQTGVNVLDRPAVQDRWDFTCVMGMYSGSFTAIPPPE